MILVVIYYNSIKILLRHNIKKKGGINFNELVEHVNFAGLHPVGILSIIMKKWRYIYTSNGFDMCSCMHDKT